MEEIWENWTAVIERKLAADRVHKQDLKRQGSVNDTIPRFLYSADWEDGPFMQGGDWFPPTEEKDEELYHL